MNECIECYSADDRITPLLNPEECLENHTQYICGHCGRCICIGKDSIRGLQRWNFPFKSLEIAKLYLRTADVTMRKACGIYEIKDTNGRKSYRIFLDNAALETYLRKNKNKTCEKMNPVFICDEYKEYSNTQIRKLAKEEVKEYMFQQEARHYCITQGKRNHAKAVRQLEAK